MATNVIIQFAKYGGFIGLLLGVIVVGMAIAVYILWKQNLKLHDRLQEVQDARVEESREMNTHLISSTTKSNEVINGITFAMNSLKDVMIMRAHRD